ncbi:RNA polymerase sigma factor [Arthrobacter tecti]
MGTPGQDDSVLWQSSRKGDGEAFGALFDRHRDRVYRHACRLTDNRTDAEDVTAAAFLELWRRRTKVTLINQSVLPWLLVTTTHCASNARRSIHRYRRLLAKLPRTPHAPDAADTFAEQNLLDGVSTQLSEALRSLNPLDLQLVTLVVLEGYTVSAAAPLLRLSPEAAKARLHRAKRRVRQDLEASNGNAVLHPIQEGQP